VLVYRPIILVYKFTPIHVRYLRFKLDLLGLRKRQCQCVDGDMENYFMLLRIFKLKSTMILMT